MENQLLFALDIGTRSVVGLIGKPSPGGLEIVATERQEHNTRSMLDGQIHDVPEVAQVISQIKGRLEERCGPLRQASVAAAGRSLCTIRTQTELDATHRGTLSLQDERTLELAALQAAQRQLALSDSVSDPSAYYCVGYSVTEFSLDGTKMISLVGQRGKNARVELIATFLPRQVINSMQSALTASGLELATMTLEPIAAINVLIPATMRHLNLALVDVGAGTSDVAITRSGSVVAYGMVPSAGDEITEAISHQYLLDFNVAESVKRQLLKQKRLTFTDVLGTTNKVATAEILDKIQPTIAELARDIAAQILSLNGLAPQAVLLVGGGALTPLLPQAIAQSLDLPAARVAVRKPETVDGIRQIPAVLREPDGVTPLGILKIAASNTLHFITVTVNDEPVRLFNLSNLTVADALLTAGIDVRSLHGRPGMGLAIRVNGETRFLPGQLGEPGKLSVNGQPAKLTDPLGDKAIISLVKGKDGASPQVRAADVIDIPEPISIVFNQKQVTLSPCITINDQSATGDAVLHDRDSIACQLPKTVGDAITACNTKITPTVFCYNVNGTTREHLAMPVILLNNQPARLDSLIHQDDVLQIIEAKLPTISEVLGLSPDGGEYLTLYFNGTPCTIPARRQTITCDNQLAAPDSPAPDGCRISYSVSQQPPTVSDVLLAADFDPVSLPNGTQVSVQLNGNSAEYTAPVKNGDRIDILIK